LPLNHINAVNAAITNIGNEWNNHKALFLTEDDIKARLIEEFRHIGSFGNYAQTADGYDTHWVHTELSILDNGGRLSIRPDIAIFDPQYLRLTGGGLVARKGVQGAIQSAILIEIKLLKFNTDSKEQSFLTSVGRDYMKLNHLIANPVAPNPNIHGIIVGCSKYNRPNIHPAIGLYGGGNIDVHYLSSNI